MPLNTTLPPDLEARLATLGDTIADACQEVEFAYLFGSVVSGRHTPTSDVDVAVHVSPSADGETVRRTAARAASRHLRSDALDVVLLNRAPLALAGRILTSRRVIVDRVPFARHRYESRIARLFADFRIRERRLLAQRYARG